ncbi:MAG: glucosaminidase domain-containing protein [Chloroflexi bacterium]|nr:glucosaminidase domain-containing protein [Chloroflexota bacterium]
MYSETSPILGPARVGAAHLAQALLARPTGEYTPHDITQIIVPAYHRICGEVGVDPVLAVAQMVHETGNLTSFWAARPQRNPAGIGVNGRRQRERPAQPRVWAFNRQAGWWLMGVSFATWQDDAIPAHIGRLLAYALPPDAGDAAQRHLMALALTYRALPDRVRGSAPTLKPLGRVHNPSGLGWASPGTQYGARIAIIANRILQRAPGRTAQDAADELPEPPVDETDVHA